MELEFAFLSDYAEQDRKLHAVGIGWNTLYAQGVPTRHPHMTFVARLVGSVAEAGTKDYGLRLIDADGEDVLPPVAGQFAFEVKPGELSASATLIMNMVNVDFPKYGRYAIHLLVQGVEMKVIRFSVLEPPQTA